MFLRVLIVCILLQLCALGFDAKAKGMDTTFVLNIGKRIDGAYLNNSKDSQYILSLQGYSLSQELGYKRGEALFLYYLGRHFFQSGDFVRGLDSVLQAKIKFEEMGDLSGLSKCYLQMGVSRYSQKMFVEALSDFKEEYKYLLKQGQSNKMGQNLYLCGLCLTELGNFKEAEVMLNRAWQLNEHFGDSQAMMETQLGLADLFRHTKQWASSENFYLYCINYNQRKNEPDGAAWSQHGLGKLYEAQGKQELALAYFHKAFANSEVFGNSFRRELYAHSLSDAYRNMGDYQNAYNYFTRYVSFKDSLFSRENLKAINTLKGRMELERKQNEVDLLGKQRQLDRVTMYILIGGALLFLLIALVLFGRYRLKSKANTQLTHSNSSLEIALASLKAAQEQLVQQEKLASLGQLTAGIAHEIKNPLNFVNNFAKLSMDLLDELSEESDEKNRLDLTEMMHDNLMKIYEHGNRANTIVQGMLLHSREGKSEKQPTDINALCKNSSELAWHGMKGAYPDFDCRLEMKLAPGLKEVSINQQDVGRVLLNLMDNAIYAVNLKRKSGIRDYQPAVTVTTTNEGGSYCIKVTDNGNGIPIEIRDKIFNPFFTTKPAGEGTGLGLSLSNDIIKSQGAALTVDSTEGEGTTFMIRFAV